MGNMQAENKLQEGAILVSLWGYDQTNVDFYQIIKLTDKTLTVRAIRSRSKETKQNMGGTAEPLRGQFAGTPFRRKIKQYGGKFYIDITGSSTARLWDGTPQRYTSYA